MRRPKFGRFSVQESGKPAEADQISVPPRKQWGMNVLTYFLAATSTLVPREPAWNRIFLGAVVKEHQNQANGWDDQKEYTG